MCHWEIIIAATISVFVGSAIAVVTSTNKKGWPILVMLNLMFFVFWGSLFLTDSNIACTWTSLIYVVCVALLSSYTFISDFLDRQILVIPVLVIWGVLVANSILAGISWQSIIFSMLICGSVPLLLVGAYRIKGWDISWWDALYLASYGAFGLKGIVAELVTLLFVALILLLAIVFRVVSLKDQIPLAGMVAVGYWLCLAKF